MTGVAAHIEQVSELVVPDTSGFHAIVAGTELPLLLRERDLRLPIHDTTRIHVAAVVDAIV